MPILDINFILNPITMNTSKLAVFLPDAAITWRGDAIELEEYLISAKRAYYSSETPIVSDRDFDLLEDTLRNIKPNSKVITGIGLLDCPSDEKIKIKHTVPMGSLVKVKTENELNKFLAKFKSDDYFLITPKFDGLACSLHYKNGRLIRAVKRGNGEIGEDATHNAIVVQNIPKHLDNNFTGEIRGEMTIMKADFIKNNEELVAAGKKLLANPRNAVSGALNQKDSTICAERRVTFIAYDVISDLEFTILDTMFLFLSRYGFTTICDYGIYVYKKDIFNNIQSKQEWTERSPVEIDGCVIAPVNMKYRELGSTNNRPNWSVAWKWESDTAEATVKYIDWQVGKSGKVTPIIVIDPVSLSGAVINRVTGYNMAFIQSIEIYENCKILIQRANEVIPKCLKRLGDEHYEVKILDKCPCCNSALEYDGVQVWCRSEHCPAKHSGRSVLFVKKLGILGFGDAVIEGLFENGLIKCPTDILTLFEDHDTDSIAIAVGGYGIMDNLKKSIAFAKTREYAEADILVALGIDGVSDGTCERLVAVYPLKELLALVVNNTPDLFLTIKDIGPATSAALYDGLARYAEEVSKMVSILRVARAEKKTGQLTGKKFCITGTLTRKRDIMEKLIIDNGGEITAVNKDKDFYLILGDDGEGTSKYKKAMSINAQLISESAVLDLLK